MASKKKPSRFTPSKRIVGYAKMQSLQAYRSPEPFMTMRVNQQTYFWIAILLVIIIAEMSILATQYDLVQVVNEIRDTIK